MAASSLPPPPPRPRPPQSSAPPRPRRNISAPAWATVAAVVVAAVALVAVAIAVSDNPDAGDGALLDAAGTTVPAAGDVATTPAVPPPLTGPESRPATACADGPGMFDRDEVSVSRAVAPGQRPYEAVPPEEVAPIDARIDREPVDLLSAAFEADGDHLVVRWAVAGGLERLMDPSPFPDGYPRRWFRVALAGDDGLTRYNLDAVFGLTADAEDTRTERYDWERQRTEWYDAAVAADGVVTARFPLDDIDLDGVRYWWAGSGFSDESWVDDTVYVATIEDICPAKESTYDANFMHRWPDALR